MRVPSSARHPSEPYTEQSIAVLYPRTTADVSRLLRDCYEKNIAVTTFGEETISDDGSTSLQGRVRMDFKYMDKVLQVHENPTSVVVQPNVELSVLNRMLESKGLFFPLDFAPGAKIGDMVSRQRYLSAPSEYTGL
jgi:D-lactate dehydrogenase (cytochrome)